MSSAGYTHVFLQVDPFYHPEADLSSDDEDALWLLSLFDITASPLNRSYRAWLGAVSGAASRHELKLGMELWEPQLPTYAQQTLPPEWKGPTLHDGSEPLCVSQPEARKWFLEQFQALLASAPAMNALALGTIDNRANLCDLRCRRCASRPVHERFSELYQDIVNSCRQVTPDFQVIPYDWEWPGSYFEATLKRMPKGTTILTRLEKGAVYTPDAAHPEWSGHVSDQSVACDQFGPGFTKAKEVASAHGGTVLAMLTLSGMFEGWELPYVPAAGQMARKFDRMRGAKVDGWVDYDCGGIHEGLMLDLVSIVQHNPGASVPEWLHLLASMRYGAAEVIPIALAAWETFDRAVRVFPAILDFKSISNFPARFGIAMGLVPMHPFLPERARQARDARQEFFWFDPHNFLTQEAMPPIRYCLRKALGHAQQGLTISRSLVSQVSLAFRPNAEFDEAMAELTVLQWKSIANFYEWAAALQGDKSVPLAQVIGDEISVTQRYRKLHIRPELEVGNMMWAWQRELSRCVPQASRDVYNCSKLTKGPIPRKFPNAIGDFYAWKLAGLEEQLKSLT